MMRTASVVAAFTITLASAGGRTAHAQSKAAADVNAQAISNGAAMFRNRCAGCHGPDAHGYLGPDLTGFWAASGTDDRMFTIVRRGVPGTEMIGADPQRVFDR